MPTKTTSSKPSSTTQTPTEIIDLGEDITPEEYEKRRKELIAKLPAEADRPLHLIDKLALITGLVGEIPKTGVNTFHHYRYAKESDLVEAIRPLLAELGVRLHQSLYGDPVAGFIPHQRLSQQKRKDGVVISESDSLTVITMNFWFESIGPDGQIETTAPQIFMGYGDDNSDKGIYKAFTGCEKYFLMKTFLVSTGDDPEGDTRADQRAQQRSQPDVQRSSRQGGKAQPAQGGRQQEASSPQVRQLGELLRQSGITGSRATLEYFEAKLGRPFPIEDGDVAGTLQDAIKAMKPDEMGKLIAGLRADIEAKEPADGVSNEPASEDVVDATTSSAEADVDSDTRPIVDDEEDAGPIA